MSIRKRNEFLDNEDSEEEKLDGYDSDHNEESRGAIVSRSTKRRRLEQESDDESIEEPADGTDNERPQIAEDASDILEVNSVAKADSDEEIEAVGERKPSKSTPKHVAAAERAAQRSGVVYISRVPPFMKPQTLKHFLLPHASKGIGRIFLTPEDQAAHSRRVKSGGNKKKSYTDGWMEFLSKREAKVAVETLNGNIIGGKKGNFYHDDLWSMKYLKGFKWNHLTEQIANENAERTARMREEVRRTKIENKAFVQDFERGKMLEGMEAKRKAKGIVNEAADSNASAEAELGRPRKGFKQKKVRTAGDGNGLSQQASRLQSMIF